MADDHVPYQVDAYFYPGWHASAPMQAARHKTGWVEWDIAPQSKPLFSGHLQPKQPLWVRFDEAIRKLFSRLSRLFWL